MPATIDCTTCATKLKLPENADTQTFQCPKCGSLIDAEAPPRPSVNSIQANPGAGSLAFQANGDAAACPYCREHIQVGARKCKHCGEILDPGLRESLSDEYHLPRRPPLPGKVQSVAIMMIVGGVCGIMLGLGLALGTCFLWIPALYSVVCGILCIVRATPLLNDKAYPAKLPRGTAVMMIVTIINGDVLNLILGIVCLVFLNDPKVQDYFSRRRPAD